MGPVRQGFTELKCSVVYDDEDRRGEDLPVEKETHFDRRERQQSDIKEKWKKRKAANKEGGYHPEPEASSRAEAKPTQKLKRRKGLKKKKAADQPQETRKHMEVDQKHVDWQAMVAEFDM